MIAPFRFWKNDEKNYAGWQKWEAADVLAWDKLKELKDSKEVIDVVVKGIDNTCWSNYNVNLLFYS